MIKMHNDGKEKSQSFEASISDFDDIPTQFGYNAEEAITNLKKEVVKTIKKLQEIDYEKIIMVDCVSKPI